MKRPARAFLISRGLPRQISLFHIRQTRSFHSGCVSSSGHSRWSTIRHDKAKNDAVKNRQRSVFAQEIATASKFFGPDPNANPRLADLITKAKKNGFAKHSIEAAIARGQGKSVTGAALESCIIEGILPGNVGVLVDCETDSRARTLQNLRLVLKRHGGNASPSNYLFEKKGKVVLEGKEGMGADEALEAALDSGALDVEEDEDGNIVVFTQPTEVRAVADSISKALDVPVSSSEIIWVPNEDTAVPMQEVEAASGFCKFVDDLNENDSTVQGVYMNLTKGSLDEATWSELQTKVNV
ncbi:DUF28-domain-containing protein [Myriangium duriaei CBS 260.36]|uniref:DUF28-domain-containing protein n=1 Tax=Myriangium duriaei CBS 260.36 TaxID=1168546 RepID=A0A9P4JC31_9PEZI|nr:DUF28-domain-containing protein [Myriangium duriaei CBS 260.36]